jgi:antibiotic biosynthesis monooxygenase (ABM) superfamily enzyme
MIGRIWHGWTTPQNADIYENLLKTDIFPGIAAKIIQGYHGVQLLRRLVGEEVEFIVIMRFESLEAVKQFAGEDYEHAYVPPKAQITLSRFDDRSQHYEIREEISY